MVNISIRKRNSKHCSIVDCKGEARYKILFTTKQMDGIIHYAWSNHISWYEQLRKNDGCICESLLRTTDPNLLIFLDELERHEILRWFKDFIRRKELNNYILKFTDDTTGHSEMPISIIEEYFENLEPTTQNRIKKDLIKIHSDREKVLLYITEIGKRITNTYYKKGKHKKILEERY